MFIFQISAGLVLWDDFFRGRFAGAAALFRAASVRFHSVSSRDGPGVAYFRSGGARFVWVAHFVGPALAVGTAVMGPARLGYLVAFGFDAGDDRSRSRRCADLPASHLSRQAGSRREFSWPLVAALLVPPLEETVFRGFILRELAQRIGWRWAGRSGGIHFHAGPFSQNPGRASTASRFISGAARRRWARLFCPCCRVIFSDGRGANLFLIGLILGGIFLRSGTLWLNAGSAQRLDFGAAPFHRA